MTANLTLTGTEVLQVQPVQSNGKPAATTGQTTTQAIANLAAAGSSGLVVTTISTVGAGTLTAAGIYGKVITRTGAQSGSAFTDTTATAAAIIAQLPAGAAVVGDAFKFTYENNTDAVATITGGVGVTVSGVTVVPPNGSADFVVTYSAASTVTMVGYQTGGYTSDTTDSTKVIAFDPSGNSTGVTSKIKASAAANQTLTLPPQAAGVVSATTGTNLCVTDIYRTSAPVTANATVTPATVTGLSGAIAIGTYRFRAVLPSTVASGTGGIAYNFLLTTAVLSAIQYGSTMKTASALQYTQGTTATSGTVVATQAAVVLETIIEGTFVVSTAGTFAIQMAQNTSNASNTVALLGGSLELSRIA